MLIIEDQLLIAEDLANLLGESGHEIVAITDTGEQAVKLALETLPDLMLVDIQLRGAMDGIEAAQAIRAQTDAAIIYLTAHAETGLFNRAKETEPDGYLYKPVSPLELSRCVEIVLFKKDMERRLKESERKYRGLVETVSDGIVQTDIAGTITFANPAYCRMLGYTVDEMTGKSSLDFQSSEPERARMRAYLEQVVSEQPDPVPWFGTHKTKSGELIFVQSSWDYRRDRQGDVIGFIAVVRDITERRKAEGALRESEERYRLLFSHERDAILLSDAETMSILDVNEACEKLWGGSRSELLSLKIPNLSAEPEKTEKALSEVMKLTDYEAFERPLKKLDGTEFIAEISVAPFKLQGRNVICSIVRDITDRKRAEESARIERRRFEALADNSPFGLVMIDDAGTFRYINQKFREMFGYETEDIPDGKTWLRKAYPEPKYRHEIIAAWLEDFSGSGPRDHRPRVFTVTCKDGSKKIVHFRPVQLPTGERLVTCEDITERWRAEEKLRQNEEEFRRIIDNLQDAFFRTDTNGIFTFLSRACEQVSGYKPEEGLGQPTALFYADPADRNEFMKRIMEKGFVNDFETRLVHKDGHIVWVSSSARLYTDREGKPAGVEGIARDISRRKKMEQDLRDREEMIRSVSDNLPAGMIYQLVREPNGARKFTYVSETVRLLYGCAPEEALRDSEWFYRSIAPEDRQRIHHEEEQSSRTLSDFRTEARMISPSGDVRWSYFASSPRKLDDGSTCWSGLEIDITDRKRIEESLRQSETKYRLMFEFSPFGVFHFDNSGIITACNDKFVQVIGSSRDSLIGLNTLRDLKDEKIMASIRKALSGGIGHYEDLYKSVTAQKASHVRCEFAPILTHDGIVLGGIGIVEDITERKAAEEALRKSEQLYRSVVENIEDVFYRSDAQGRLLMGSPSGARLFGYDSLDEMIGLPMGSFWADPKKRHELLDIIREQGKATDYEATLKRKDGSTFIASLTTHFYRDEDGTALGTEGIVRDISERKRMEAHLLQSQKMQAMGTLAGGVAHEINNLLQVILGHADMLRLKGREDKRFERSFEAICRAARSGADLVNRILTFSRKTQPEMRPTRLSDEVRKLEDLLRRTIPRMIVLEMRLEDNLLTINADPAQIGQILLNLTLNAKDAMRQGGRLVFETKNVTIGKEFCRIHPEFQPGTYVSLTVSDTGAGMAKQTLERLFEPFFTTKPPGKGTGLGLSVVFGVVKNHGGHIICDSEPDVGTTFEIYFPVWAGDFHPQVPQTVETPPGGTETLLLVDDEEAVRTLAAEMLESAGYNVLVASNGKEALDIYRTNGESIALVILDLIMPEMSGGECLQELLKISPNTKVLISSGYADDGVTKEAREGGAAGFVSKPYSLDQVLHAIRKCLDRV